MLIISLTEVDEEEAKKLNLSDVFEIDAKYPDKAIHKSTNMIYGILRDITGKKNIKSIALKGFREMRARVWW